MSNTQTSTDRAREYVGGLRRTNQWRKTYYYGVVFEGERIIGHIPATNRQYIERHPVADGRTMTIIRGKDA